MHVHIKPAFVEECLELLPADCNRNIDSIDGFFYIARMQESAFGDFLFINKTRGKVIGVFLRMVYVCSGNRVPAIRAIRSVYDFLGLESLAAFLCYVHACGIVGCTKHV